MAEIDTADPLRSFMKTVNLDYLCRHPFVTSDNVVVGLISVALTVTNVFLE